MHLRRGRVAWQRESCRKQDNLPLPSQHSDSDSDPEYSSLPPSIPSAVPVTGESFCDCEGQNEATFCNSLHTTHRSKDCRCGEEDEGECLVTETCGGLGRFSGTRKAPLCYSPP